MPKKFDARAHLGQLAGTLIAGFDEAGVAQHGDMRGRARETAARRKLKELLPAGVGIGSGAVVDSYGGISRQQDIILYEQALCPIFPIGEGGDSYYPIEGVIAVGEVKSLLTAEKLKDAFENVASAKSLRRRETISQFVDWLPPLVPARQYCSTTMIIPSEGEGFAQRANPYDQIFGFILCHELQTSGKALIGQVARLSEKTPRSLAPNVIASLSNGFVSSAANGEMTSSAVHADELLFCDEAVTGFIQLVLWLRTYSIYGRTVALEEYDHYFRSGSEPKFRISASAKAKWATD